MSANPDENAACRGTYRAMGDSFRPRDAGRLRLARRSTRTGCPPDISSLVGGQGKPDAIQRTRQGAMQPFFRGGNELGPAGTGTDHQTRPGFSFSGVDRR